MTMFQRLTFAAIATAALAGCASPMAHLATSNTGADSPLAQAMQADDHGSYTKQTH